MERVFVSRRIPDIAISMLSEFFEVDIYSGDKAPSKDVIIDRINGCFAFVPMVSDRVDSDVIEAFSGRIIANYGVGYNNIDVEAATRKGIFVTNTPDVLSQATAELAWSLILSASRFHYAAGKHLREGKFSGFDPLLFLGMELYGATLGIVGMGRIGSIIARIGRFGFNMNVLYHNRRKSDREQLVDGRWVTFEELLRESDVVVVAASFDGSNKHMMDKKAFSIMKNRSVFVNVSRGDIVDTGALVWALKTGKLLACGLDVYENEPSVEKDLLEFDNCVLLPHIGSATIKARGKMAEIVARNIISVYKGDCPETPVNGEELCHANT